MTELEQLQLVGKVMEDRTLHSRSRSRVARMYELGLPKDADVAHLAALWLEKRFNEVYINQQQ